MEKSLGGIQATGSSFHEPQWYDFYNWFLCFTFYALVTILIKILIHIYAYVDFFFLLKTYLDWVSSICNKKKNPKKKT